MSTDITAYLGARIYGGDGVLDGHALLVRGARIMGIVPQHAIPQGARRHPLAGGILAPGFVDLQVNGGGGVMFNDAPTLATLRMMAKAHGRLGATSILPTLISDTAQQTRAAIAAVQAAIAQNVAGIVGLHLEGPHLAQARAGAHDAALIRKMDAEDEAVLLAAARTLPVLMVTVAPESVTPGQMRRLSDAGILLSLGHSDASYAAYLRAAQNGVRGVTHLFNAMSQLRGREPGLVGAALDCPLLSAGLIADLIHVHPAAIRSALRAKAGPGQIFLVSDAMATAGSDIDHFYLNGRRVARVDQRLTLADNTLAGADLDLVTAVFNIVRHAALDVRAALAMATSVPAQLIGRAPEIGHLASGSRADFVHIHAEKIESVWQAGRAV